MKSIHQYDDILTLPHPDPKTHDRMPIRDRAAQFMPFAALSGYSAIIAEISRVTERKITLDESEKSKLNRKLIRLRSENKPVHDVRIEYFEPDEKKEGGRYLTAVVSVQKIDEFRQVLITDAGAEIAFEDILTIEFQDRPAG